MRAAVKSECHEIAFSQSSSYVEARGRVFSSRSIARVLWDRPSVLQLVGVKPKQRLQTMIIC